MSDTLKSAGASCPKCHAYPCAESQQAGQEPKWVCNGCGAHGTLTGKFFAANRAPQTAKPVKEPPPWIGRNLQKGMRP